MIILILLLMEATIAGTDVVRAPSTIRKEKGAIVVHEKNGAPRWSAEWTMEPALEQGRAAVRFTETGRGRYSPFKEDVRWSSESIWTAERSFAPLRFEKIVTDVNGRRLAMERKDFDQAGGRVRFERTGSHPETKSLSVPPDTLAVEGIAGILRFMPFEQAQPFAAHFLTNEPRLFEITIEMRGKERVKTPAGEYECYKLELVPRLGILNVLRPFFPRAYFWFAVAAPHFWVRYEGPENGPGTPHIVMELKSYESDP